MVLAILLVPLLIVAGLVGLTIWIKPRPKPNLIDLIRLQQLAQRKRRQ